MRLLLLLALLVTGFASAAQAEDCSDAATQADMNVCADKEFQKADAELNTLYRHIKARLAGDVQTADLLVAAQRAWLPFRDAECKFAASGVEGGSIYPTIYALCLRDITAARVEDLRTYLSCEEGDLSCPVPPQ